MDNTTPVPAHRLLSSPSNKLKLETPCSFVIQTIGANFRPADRILLVDFGEGCYYSCFRGKTKSTPRL